MKGLHFPRYLAYGFGVPLLFILFCVVLDESNYIKDFSMQYGQCLGVIIYSNILQTIVHTKLNVVVDNNKIQLSSLSSSSSLSALLSSMIIRQIWIVLDQ